MRALYAPVRLLVLVCALLQFAHAKINYAYVGNNASNTVSVINTANNSLVSTIAVGTNPFAVAVNQAGTFVYVANYGSGNVSVITTSTNTVAATIPVGAAPDGIVLAPNGKVAYVANQGSNSVSVINTSSHAVTATISVQTQPAGIAISPIGTFVYVVNSGSNSVSVISTLTNKVVATISVGSNPVWVAISPDGSTACVTNYGTGTVSVIHTADNSVVNTINVAPHPYGDAISPDGQWLYVASAGVVTVIDTSTQTVAASIATAGGTSSLVSFSQDSALAYVSEPAGNAVEVIKTASKTVATSITVGTTPIGVAVMGTMKVTTVAGGFLGDGLAATSAALGGPYTSLYDSAGNLYIADFLLNRVRKVSTTGVISTYAGTGICGYNGDNITAKKAMLCAPNGLLLDSSGNLLVADGGNSRIRKITRLGVITTIAGTGVFGYSGDGGPALNARIGQPVKMAYDAAGNLFFAQVGNCVVRKIDTSGNISTVAGNGSCGFSGDNGSATNAQLNFPRAVAFDSNGNLYIGDTGNRRVRKVTPTGIITTFAGTGGLGCGGDGGPASTAAVGNPLSVAVRNGVLYISTGSCARVRAVDLTTNVISTYAGSFYGYDGDGHSLTATRFAGLHDTSFDAAGNPVFSDGFNGRVRKAIGGIVNTIAGGFIADGSKAISAALVFPEAMFIDRTGNQYIADYTGNRIRKVSAGIIATIAGNGISGYSGDSGPATSATLNEPLGVAVDSLGNVFIADTNNAVIRRVDTTGTISTFASNAGFSILQEMAVDGSNNLYIADYGACVVWKITPAAAVSIAAGVLNTCGYNGDGIAATSAQLSLPYAVAADSHGNLFIADSGNNRVRQVNTSGMIGTIAGNGTCGNSGDGGSATAAELCPNAVAVNSAGTIYVADFTFERIRKISNGTITTFAGARSGFNGDGLWPLYSAFDDPVALAVDAKGAVYEVDDWDHRIRKIQ